MSDQVNIHSGFADRHIGPTASDQVHMLAVMGAQSLDDLVDEVVPGSGQPLTVVNLRL